MTYTAVDCLGFAGGFTLGMVQAGFELVGKRELPGGFGVANCEANRALLGDRWRTEVGAAETWSRVDADVVFGNPPCSGFSVMTDKRWRGVDAKVNACMWSFSNFVADVRPTVAVMESVRVAFTTGRSLMQDLRANVEARTGLRYNVHHVYQDALALGGAAKRPRYFFVLSQVPFGVEYPRVYAPTLRDVIEDLEGLEPTWELQPYRRTPTWWSKAARSDEIGPGLRYNVHHVYQDALALGGAAKRPRYFFVLSQVPFGVEHPRVYAPTLRDVIEDLEGLEPTWELQPYRRPPTWWSKAARSDAGVVDGHVGSKSPYVLRAMQLLEALDGDWPQGMAVAKALERYYREHGEVPPLWQHMLPKLIAKDFFMGFTTMVRW